MNLRHALDPVCSVRPLHPPPPRWFSEPSTAGRVYTDVLLPAADIQQPNVHAMSHYLSHPLVHVPLLGRLANVDSVISERQAGRALEEWRAARMQGDESMSWQDRLRQLIELLARIDVIRSINLLVQEQKHAQSPTLQTQLRDAQTELARWQAYRRDSRHQSIWELWAYSQLMTRDPSICARDGSNGLIGFCKVPTSQLVLLHPDASLIATRPSGQPTQLQPALIIDVIGAHALSWQYERSARIERQWGYALSATCAQVDGRPQWSYGPRLHMDGYNLALTRSEGGGWNLVVSLNLAERYMERKKSYTRDLMRVKGSGLLRALDR